MKCFLTVENCLIVKKERERKDRKWKSMIQKKEKVVVCECSETNPMDCTDIPTDVIMQEAYEEIMK